MTEKSEVFEGGPTTSQHIIAQDDDHFEKSTFKLKRTRSLGLLDEFIPGMTEKDNQNQNNNHETDNKIDTKIENIDNKINKIDNNFDNKLDSKLDNKFDNNNDDTNFNTNANFELSNNKIPDSIDLPQHISDKTDYSSPVYSSSSSSLSVHSQESDKHPVVHVDSVMPHDDVDITNEPSRHVDYLAYQWDVSDIAKSWRYVIQKRKDVANAARLENASWRTWAQRRSNLKTISPEVVNWSKDSDVTWLYGPIVKDETTLRNEQLNDENSNFKQKDISDTASFAVAGDVSIPSRSSAHPKPILKRRTIEESMISHSNLLKLELAANKVHQKQRESYLNQQNIAATGPKDHDFNDYDAILAKLNKQYQNTTPTSNTSVTKLQELLNKKQTTTNTDDNENNDFNEYFDKKNSDSDGSTSSVPSKSAIKKPISLRNEVVTSPSLPPKPTRHIHFNERVQQCIAIDYVEEDFELDSDYFDKDDDYNGLNHSIYNLNSPDDSAFVDITHDHLNANIDPYNEEDDDDDDDEDDDDDDDEGGFFLKVKSGAPPNLAIASSKEQTEDSESISTSNSKVYRTIQLLPSTTINYASSEEESDYENPYSSSMSHNVENRGYDFYYDYNSVYTCDDSYGRKADVVDVPDNITLGSNIDYEMLDSGMNSSVHTQSPIYSPQILATQPDSRTSPIIHAMPHQPIYTQSQKQYNNIKNSTSDSTSYSDSDSNSDSDDGLLISASSSSKNLAQSIFGMSNTHYPDGNEKEPIEAPTSSINPRRSNTNLVKQPHSSSSLSDQFFGTNTSTGLTKVDDDTPLTKQPPSNSNLSDQFFGATRLKSSSSDLSHQFFGTTPQDHRKIENTPPEQTPSPSNSFSTQKKSTPLPPHTTSANAFLGSTPPKSNKTFLFDDDSDSEEEEIQIKSPTPGYGTGNTPSYNSLSQVADKSGLKSPSTESNSVVYQAKDFANHFLGRK